MKYKYNKNFIRKYYNNSYYNFKTYKNYKKIKKENLINDNILIYLTNNLRYNKKFLKKFYKDNEKIKTNYKIFFMPEKN